MWSARCERCHAGPKGLFRRSDRDPAVPGRTQNREESNQASKAPVLCSTTALIRIAIQKEVVPERRNEEPRRASAGAIDKRLYRCEPGTNLQACCQPMAAGNEAQEYGASWLALRLGIRIELADQTISIFFCGRREMGDKGFH